MLNTAIAVEGDAEAGKTKSAVCAACHGATGISPAPIYPNLAGQNAAYMIKQLTDFKSGDRTDMLMAPMAVNLSEQDMADVAAYFSSQPRSVVEVTAVDTDAAASAPGAVANVAVVTSTSAKAIYKGDVKLGQKKSGMCVACHGTDGNSALSIYPKLAGQSANYLSKQLADFKSGDRVDPIMAGMVAGLSTKDMDDLAAYYAVQKMSEGTGETSLIGKNLYFGGNAEKGITACIACHGVKGKGVPQAGFPAIAGQNTEYLKSQLLTFRDASRTNDHNNMMGNIAIKLSDSDIEALVKYMSSLK